MVRAIRQPVLLSGLALGAAALAAARSPGAGTRAPSITRAPDNVALAGRVLRAPEEDTGSITGTGPANAQAAEASVEASFAIPTQEAEGSLAKLADEAVGDVVDAASNEESPGEVTLGFTPASPPPPQMPQRVVGAIARYPVPGSATRAAAPFEVAAESAEMAAPSAATVTDLPTNGAPPSSGTDGGVFLEASSAGTVANSALLQRLAKVEALESAEKQTLAAQQKVLQAIVAQQAALSAQQQGLKAEHEEMEAKMQFGASSLIKRLRAKTDPALQTVEFRWRTFLSQILIYVTFSLIVGYIFAEKFTYEFDKLNIEPRLTREDFAFNLFYGINLDPDWRICFFSCFCTPVRWAATASAEKIRFIHYWTGIALFAFLTACAPLTLSLSTGTLLVITTRNRQRIRKVYGMPYGGWGTVLQDCCVWLMCPCCATMQEAMQVEFMDPPISGDAPASVSTAFAPKDDEEPELGAS